MLRRLWRRLFGAAEKPPCAHAWKHRRSLYEKSRGEDGYREVELVEQCPKCLAVRTRSTLV